MRSKLLFFFVLSLAGTIVTSAQTNYNLSNLTLFDGEPYIAVNPANQSNIIAGWMRLRIDGKIWIATKASFDKGQTWSAINFMPHDTIINGSADVSIAFHNSGTAYLSWINFRTSPDTAGAVYLSKSIDGGLTWGNPSRVIGSADLSDLPFDRPWVAVDNSGGPNDGKVFVTSMTAYWISTGHHIYLRTSGDNGATWSTIKQVDNTAFSVGSLNSSYGGISIGKDGRAYIVYISYDTTTSPFVRFYSATTTNGGTTFQRNVIGRAFISGGSGFTKAWCVSANPIVNNNAILTWIDNRYGDYDIVISKTSNGGLTWSTPLRVNDDAVNNGIEQDMVWADFSSSGKLAIAWRDRRLNGIGSTVPFDIFTTLSTDTANTFSTNYRVTTVSNPYFFVPQGNSFIGVAMSDSSIYMDWGDYRNSPDWDIYFNRTDVPITGINLISSEIPSHFSISQNYPNPFNPSTVIKFQVANYSNVKLIVLDALGRELTAIVDEQLTAGTYEVNWNADKFSSGVYYYKLTAGDYTATKKMILLK